MINIHRLCISITKRQIVILQRRNICLLSITCENFYLTKMSAPYTKLKAPTAKTSKVCRGCMTDSGEMKNMYEWDLSEDYYRITEIATTRRKGLSELLCAACEGAMISCKQFRDQCQLSDKKLKTSLTLRAKEEDEEIKRNFVRCILTDQQLLLMITAPQQQAKIKLPCPFHCEDGFYKTSHLDNHLKKIHNVCDKFEIEIRFYCPELNCPYHIDSDKNKWFSGRKFLNQHVKKVHNIKTYFCNDCSQVFAIENDLKRHLKTCKFFFICDLCDAMYGTNEKLMVHLKRKHPNAHQMYKNEKAGKRKGKNGSDEKKKKKKTIDSDDSDETTAVAETVVKEEVAVETETAETWMFNETEKKKDTATKNQVGDVCESPKKSSATQIPEDIRNDVSLLSWQSKNEFEIKTDEISTQVGFEDLLSLRSQNSEDEIFFSDPVSLSDIQTQTFPLEFGLSRSHKETQSCMNTETQSPDLSIKETQTCFCHQDSARPNFRLFDSLSSSPASINHTSTETQTTDPRDPVISDVLLSFSSAETQTCFDQSNDSI